MTQGIPPNLKHGSFHLFESKQKSVTGGVTRVPYCWDAFTKKWYLDAGFEVPIQDFELEGMIYAGEAQGL